MNWLFFQHVLPLELFLEEYYNSRNGSQQLKYSRFIESTMRETQLASLRNDVEKVRSGTGGRPRRPLTGSAAVTDRKWQSLRRRAAA